MNYKNSVIFVDPYSNIGAHPSFNQNFISSTNVKNYKVIFGFFNLKSRFFLAINCFIIFFRIFFKPSYAKIYFLAWPNKLIFLLNFLCDIKGSELILILHNNIERMSSNDRKKIKFNLIVLDSGLLKKVNEYFHYPQINLFPHPLPSSKISLYRDKKKSLIKSFIFYAFGKINFKELHQVKLLLKKYDHHFFSRGFVDNNFLPMKRFSTSEDYFLAIKKKSGLIVLPCDKYRATASGFILDCISMNLIIFLPNDFPLKFDVLDNVQRKNLIYYNNIDELFLLLTEKFK